MVRSVHSMHSMQHDACTPEALVWRAVFDAEVDVDAFAAECGEAMALIFAEAAANSRRYMNGASSSSNDEADKPTPLGPTAAKHATPVTAFSTPAPQTASRPFEPIPPLTSKPPSLMHDLDRNGCPYGASPPLHRYTTTAICPHSVSGRRSIR